MFRLFLVKTLCLGSRLSAVVMIDYEIEVIAVSSSEFLGLKQSINVPWIVLAFTGSSIGTGKDNQWQRPNLNSSLHSFADGL